VGGLHACVDVLFGRVPLPGTIVQREQDVIAVAFVARMLAVTFEQPHAHALGAVGRLVAGAVRITRETIERLGRYLLVDDLDDLVEAADAASFEAALKARGPLAPETLTALRDTWHDDWLRRLTSPRDEDDRGSILDPVAELRDWPRRALWRWRRPAERESGPERSIVLWSDLVHAAFTGAIPLAFGVLALERLGLTPSGATVGLALEQLRGAASTRRRLADVFQLRRPAPNRVLLVETQPDGVGEHWDVDTVYPTLLLNTLRGDALDVWTWAREHIEPQAPVLHFGRMDPGFVSDGPDLDAYVLQQGDLKIPGALDRPVLSDPGSPRALVEALERLRHGD